MAEISKSGTPSPCTPVPPFNARTSFIAGETLAPGDACYIKTSDGKAWRSIGAAANAAANVHGFAAVAAVAGDAITLLDDINWFYGSGLTPGATYFLSGTVAGGLADAASTGGTVPCGFAVDATRVRLFKSVIR